MKHWIGLSSVLWITVRHNTYSVTKYGVKIFFLFLKSTINAQSQRWELLFTYHCVHHNYVSARLPLVGNLTSGQGDSYWSMQFYHLVKMSSGGPMAKRILSFLVYIRSFQTTTILKNKFLLYSIFMFHNSYDKFDRQIIVSNQIIMKKA